MIHTNSWIAQTCNLKRDHNYVQASQVELNIRVLVSNGHHLKELMK